MIRHAAPVLLLSLLVAPAAALAETATELPDAAPFAEGVSDVEYARRLDDAIARLEPGRRVIAVFGANWCHDSRALAGWLTSPALQPMLSRNFDVVFIDIGHPQAGQGRNLDLAARYGVSDIGGTPNLLVINGDGMLVNTPESAKGWRNAASRSEESIRAVIESYADDVAPRDPAPANVAG